MSEAPKFDLNTPDGGRGYIAHLFKTVLKRHDYRQYIAERLAGDFACTLAQHFERITAERDALQLRLNAAYQRIDELTTKPSDVERQRLMEIIEQYPNGDPLEYDAAVRKLQQ
jgi:hypothetical protein